MTRRYNSADSKRRILAACVQLFINNGYNNTTVAEILKLANVSSSTFQNVFRAKEGVLVDLLDVLYSDGYDSIQKYMEIKDKPLLVYALSCSVQIAVTELDENIRDVFSTVYTKRESSEYIYQDTTNKVKEIFSSYHPEFSSSDFYELSIGACGIMSAYISKPCDNYFTLDGKIKRVLQTVFSIFKIPDADKEEVFEYIRSIDITAIAQQEKQRIIKELTCKFEE